MEVIKNIDDFKTFIDLNREKIYANAIKADALSVDDEWMKEDQWDEIYKQEVLDGKI